MNKDNVIKTFLTCFILSLILVVSLVVADVSPPEEGLPDEELKKLEETGVLSEDLVKTMPDWTAFQKGQVVEIVENLGDKSKEFWEQWKILKPETTKNFLKELSQLERDSFTGKWGESFGLPPGVVFGFNEQTVLQGTRAGNERIFFDAEKAKGKVLGVGYKYNSDYDKGVDIMRFFMKDRGYAEVLVGKDQKGYYFDVESNTFYKLKEENGNFYPDKDSPLTVVWNGKGHLTIDASLPQTRVSLSFSRDDEGDPDATKFAAITTNNGDSYSAYQKPKGKDNEGNDIFRLDYGEIAFDENGKPVVLSDVYKRGDWGGFFGKDVRMFYDKEEYSKLSSEEKSRLGSYLIVDEKNKFIGGNLARTQGVLPGSEFARSLNDYISDLDKKVGGTLRKIDLAQTIRAGAALAGKDVDLFKNYLVNDLGLSEDGFIVRAASSEVGVNTIRSSLGYASSFLGASGDLASAASSKLDYLAGMVPEENTRLDLHLSNDFAKKIENIELMSGTLGIEDSRGNLVDVVKKATAYGYYLDSDFNKNNPSFEGVNFNLVNPYVPELQIQIYSDNYGDLNAKGIGSTSLESTGKYTIGAFGSVTVSGRFGLISRTISDGEWIGSAEFLASEDALKKAEAYLAEATREYKATPEYNALFGEGVYNKEADERLVKMADDITQEYYKILGGGDVGFRLDILGSESYQQFQKGVNQVAERLEGFASASNENQKSPDTQNRVIQEVIASVSQRFFSDERFRAQFTERKITSAGAVENAVNTQLVGMSRFLKSNTGRSVEFIEDSKNNLYQLNYGDNTYNLDPAIAPIVSDVMPIILGSAKMGEDGKLIINNDIWNRRFVGDKNIVGGASMGVSGIIYALRNKDAIKYSIGEAVKRDLIEKANKELDLF